MNASQVSVVVVSYNTREQLARCLSCIEPRHEVIVVDNASSDGSPEMVRDEFPHVRLIVNSENVGFGAANNQGLEVATRTRILLLNSDAYAGLGAIDTLAKVFIDDQVVAAGGRLLNPDGSLQNSSANNLTLWAVFCEQSLLEKAFPWSRLFSPYWNTRRLQKISEVEQVMGACLMMRPIARFDDRYFLYCEDTDLCYRLRTLGKILYVPEAQFVHELGSSTTDRWVAIARYNRGKELFFSIHRGPTASFVCLLMDRLGSLLRLAIWTAPTILTLGLVGRLRRQVRTFWKVLTAPREGPPRPTRTPQGSPRADRSS